METKAATHHKDDVATHHKDCHFDYVELNEESKAAQACLKECFTDLVTSVAEKIPHDVECQKAITVKLEEAYFLALRAVGEKQTHPV